MDTQCTSPAFQGKPTAGLMDRHLSDHLQPRKSDSRRKQLGREAFMKDVRFCRTDKGKIIAVRRDRVRRQPEESVALGSAGRTIYNSDASAPCITEIIEAAWLGEGTEITDGWGSCQLPFVPDLRGVDVCVSEWCTEPKDSWSADSCSSSESGRSTPELGWVSSSPSVACLDETRFFHMDLDAVFHEFIDIKQCEGL